MLPLALGISDGILNALTLASAAVLRQHGILDASLALRVAVVSLVTTVFTVFVAEYAQLRGQLAKAEHELNITTSGRLAASSLGRVVARDATEAAALASAASFLGAVGPLAFGAAIPRYPWLAIVVAVAALGVLGAVLAAVIGGNRTRWAVILAASGVAVAAIGTQLEIV